MTNVSLRCLHGLGKELGLRSVMLYIETYD